MSARNAILARLEGPTPFAAEAAALLGTPERPAVEASNLEAEFLARLALPSVNASHDRIASLADLPAAIARYLIAQKEPLTLCCPPDPRLTACDWSAFTLHADAAPDEGATLAIARKGIAETGSLIFETSPVAPMLPNFLTLHHIVLLATRDIDAHLEDAPLPGPQPRAHYWITGVSGTTDIEGTYVRGAHGPRFLHVILLQE
ncbi:L-lactate dehydrogenase complex protein LldG [Sphingobium xenophagum]|uniref:L-lactate dehydrogenase complex protein LldG n=1 Tax=Sphingobium xenophagum TaxID=121428 RepID=A0ABU1WYB5_SPHXE|nr:LUD domain-containing protein [Sphingobium xenophagum]MDR7154301.1 L-lactate dehydrogenase complex protein LldG [Sphingobium xenophagum]